MLVDAYLAACVDLRLVPPSKSWISSEIARRMHERHIHCNQPASWCDCCNDVMELSGRVELNEEEQQRLEEGIEHQHVRDMQRKQYKANVEALKRGE